MNLINELHTRRYTLETLSNIYFKSIMESVLEFKRSGTEFSKETYKEYSEQDNRLFNVTYIDFKKLIDLSDDYEKKNKTESNDKIRSITNLALIRRLSQDMCDDVKNIFNTDYRNLCKLGYLGEIDGDIPEIVRGNFLLYARKEALEEEVSGCNEAIDRMNYVLLRSTERKHASLDENMVNLYFVKMPISKIRRELVEMHSSPVTDYREKYLSDFFKECYQKLKTSNFDVENKLEKKIDKMMDGNELVTEKDYKYISSFGYDGSEGHPLIQNGYKLYANIYVLEKTKKSQLELAKDYYSDVCLIDGARLHLESPEYDEIPNSFNCMTVLIHDFAYTNVSRKYNKGKATKEEYEKAKHLKKMDDRYSEVIKLAKKIGGVEKISFDNRAKREYDID